jgi:hypothetical protein
LGLKDGIFDVRFRFRGKEFKKSLKTPAQAACHLIELTIHRLYTGQTQLQHDVDPGDFILSGGTLLKPPDPRSKPVALPSTKALAEEYGLSDSERWDRASSIRARLGEHLRVPFFMHRNSV